ncbi:MAG: hypothetical protein ACR2NP_21510, partial [Pirellulaceae bacterium]
MHSGTARELKGIQKVAMDWWNKPRSVQILVDNDSWILPWAERLCEQIITDGNRCELRRAADELTPGDVVFLLGCTRMVPAKVLNLNKRNLVVHESDLPRGRGFAPISWQVLADSDKVTICLLEAARDADAGDVFLRHRLSLRGDELCDELRTMQGRATVEICLEYLRARSEPRPMSQHGEPTWLPRRTPEDSRLDADKSLREQFNLLRICDNQRYPAFFELDGNRYELRITKAAADSPTDNLPNAGDSGATYLVAGCKSWNRTAFDQHRRSLAGNWHFVDSPELLTSEFVRELRPASIFFLHWSWMV